MTLIRCPNCVQSFHETTEKFNPDVRPNGSMVRLRQPWRGWGWSPFGGEDGRDIRFAESEATLCSDLRCPGCGSPLAPGGRLTIIEEPKQGPQEEKGESISGGVIKIKEPKELVAAMISAGKPWKEMLKKCGLNAKGLSEMIKEVQQVNS